MNREGSEWNRFISSLFAQYLFALGEELLTLDFGPLININDIDDPRVRKPKNQPFGV